MRYRIAASPRRPARIDVELRYQPIGYRWAHNLGALRGPGAGRFVKLFDPPVSAASVVVATAA